MDAKTTDESPAVTGDSRLPQQQLQQPRMVWIPHKKNVWTLAKVINLSENTDIADVGNGSGSASNEDSLTITVKEETTTTTTTTAASGGLEVVSATNTGASNNPELQTLQRSAVHPLDPTHLLNLDNLCYMNNLHEAPLLDLLRRRFFASDIYTYTGDVLISLNPYTTIPGLYDDPLRYLRLRNETVMESITSSSPSSSSSSSSRAAETASDKDVARKPHVYQIANNALKKLCQPAVGNAMMTSSTADDIIDSSDITASFRNQSIIVSGESGAGKTEASKLVLNFLINANSTTAITGRGAAASAASGGISKVLLESSVVFESFGNAKTVRNDNSSRFGKYIKLLYSEQPSASTGGGSSSSSISDGKMMVLRSAKTETFLLEKSRLVGAAEGERNYHVFYQLLSGLRVHDIKLYEELYLAGRALDIYGNLIDPGPALSSDGGGGTGGDHRPTSAIIISSSSGKGLLSAAVSSSSSSVESGNRSTSSSTIRPPVPPLPDVVSSAMQFRMLVPGGSSVGSPGGSGVGSGSGSGIGTFSSASGGNSGNRGLSAANSAAMRSKGRGSIVLNGTEAAAVAEAAAAAAAAKSSSSSINNNNNNNNNSNTADNSCSDDAQEFALTLKALQILGLSEDEIRYVWSILAAIMHLYNVQVQSLEDNGTAGVGGSDGSGTGEDKVYMHSPTIPFAELSSLLGLQPETFELCLTTQQMRVARRMSVRTKVLGAADVRNNIAALGKWLYSRLFDWLVRKINYAYQVSTTQHDDCSDDFENNNSGTATTTTIRTPAGQNNDPDKDSAFIGILDIFGFEILTVNSFEQLCINFTNERLQQQFNEYVFVTEQQIYATEGLDWTAVSFKNNQHVIDLISCKKSSVTAGTGSQQAQGLLQILEEHCLMNRAPDDGALIAGFNAVHDIAGTGTGTTASAVNSKSAQVHPYAKSRFGKTSFIVRHFAGEVVYEITGFISKNNDSLQDDLMSLLNTSENVFVRNAMNVGEPAMDEAGYIPITVTANGGRYVSDSGSSSNSNDAAAVAASDNEAKVQTIRASRLGLMNGGTAPGDAGAPAVVQKKKMAAASTVSLQFREQLDDLMGTLRRTFPHYIKCVKPNAQKAAQRFEAPLAMQQLRYSGVLEVVRIRREGFPVRRGFAEFYAAYEVLAPQTGEAKTSIFAKSADDATLSVEEARACAQYIAQRALQSHSFQCGHSMLFLRDGYYREMKEAVKRYLGTKAVKIQSKQRARRAFRLFQRQRSIAVVLQALLRKFVHRKKFLRIKTAALKIKWFLASKRLRSLFQRQYEEIKKQRRILKAKMFVFRTILVFLARRRLRKNKQQIVLLQTLYRGRLAKKRRNRLFTSVMHIAHAVLSYVKTKRAVKYLHLCRHSAIKIQTQWRGVAARQAYFILMANLAEKSAVLIQTAYRRSAAQRYFDRCMWAALLVQSVFRMKIAKRRKKASIYAVVTAQKLMRGFLTRIYVEKKQRAIVQVQSQLRVFFARRKYVQSWINVVTVQSLVRRFLAAKRFVRLMCNIMFIQTRMRIRLSRMRAKRRLRAIVVIQAFRRSVIYSRRFTNQLVSAIVAQSCIRGFLCRRAYKLSRHRIIKVQAFIRSVNAQIGLQHAIAAAIFLQAIARMRIQRNKYNEVIISTIIIQSSVRRKLGELHYTQIRHAVQKMQAVVRGDLARKHFRIQMAAILCIQSVVRMKIARDNLDLAIVAASIIQSVFRMKLARIRYAIMCRGFDRLRAVQRGSAGRKYAFRKFASIVAIQSVVRMKPVYRRYQDMVFSALVLQTYYRMYLQREWYRLQRGCALRIQTCFRMHVDRVRFLALVRGVTLLAALHRCRTQSAVYYMQRLAADILQRKSRVFGRHCALWHRLQTVHGACRAADGTVIGGPLPPGAEAVSDVERVMYVQHDVQTHSDALVLRNKWMQSCTLLQSALLDANPPSELISMLSPSYHHLLLTDAFGRNSAHYIALRIVLRIKIAAKHEARHMSEHQNSLLAKLDRKAAKHQAEREAEEAATAEAAALARGENTLGSAARWQQGSIVNSLQQLVEALNVYEYQATTGIVGTAFEADDDDDEDGPGSGGLESGKSAGGEHAAAAAATARAITNASNELRKHLRNSVSGGVTAAAAAAAVAADGGNNTNNNNNNTSNNTDNNGGSTLQKTGWLKKKRGGLMWQKRYFALTDDYIIYYKSEESLNKPMFAIPLQGCTVTRVPGKENVIEITSPHMKEKRSIFGSSNKKSISLCADTEAELQEWLYPLKSLSGIGTLRSAGVKTPVGYVNMTVRQIWLGAVTNEKDIPARGAVAAAEATGRSHVVTGGDSPLHLLARAAGIASASTGAPDAKVGHRQLQAAAVREAAEGIAWLVANSAPGSVNAQNKAGDTPLHVAVREFIYARALAAAAAEEEEEEEDVNQLQQQHPAMLIIMCLISRGADAHNLHNEDGKTVMDLIHIAKGQAHACFAAAVLIPMLASTALSASSSVSLLPPRVSDVKKGYSYLQLYIGTMISRTPASASAQSARVVALQRARAKHTLTVSVFNKKGALIESAVEIVNPAYVHFETAERALNVSWGWTWHMHTPLENLLEGSYLLVEFSDDSAATVGTTGDKDGSVARWVRYGLHCDHIDSCTEQWRVNMCDSSVKGPHRMQLMHIGDAAGTTLGEGGSRKSVGNTRAPSSSSSSTSNSKLAPRHSTAPPTIPSSAFDETVNVEMVVYRRERHIHDVHSLIKSGQPII